MKDFAGLSMSHDSQCTVSNIPNVNKRTHGMPPSMQLQFSSGQEKENCSWDNSVKLLAGAIDIRRPCKHNRETIIPVKSHKTHVCCCPGHGIWSAGVIICAFWYCSLTTAIYFRGRNMDIFFQKTAFAQFIMEFDRRDNVGHHPVLRIRPTFSYHALCRKVDNIAG